MTRYSNLKNENILDVIRLIRSENIGSKTFFDLISYYGNVKDAINAIPELAKKGGKRAIKLCSQEKAEQELESATKYGAEIILYGSEKYPALLQNIYDPPPIITVLGNPEIWSDKTSVAIVGSRGASSNGFRFSHKIAHDLTERGYLVTSGLARGVDTAAHNGSVEKGTVAVIAGGIDNIYPPENKGLYQKIAETGAIISEQPFGGKPYSRAFPARNRIISGMSVGVVVVEASFRSGSLITARYALEENKEVMAVPNFPLDPRSQGTNKLIKDGAALVETVDDIINIVEQNAPKQAPLLDLMEDSAEFSHEPSEQNTEDLQEALLAKLTSSPTLVDDLISQMEVSSSDMMITLLELELAGKIERHVGNKVSLVYG